ncbi:MAG TPA: biopolymer transporter ExbD [Puia sp.]|nr:biopolymer transporter ExbD [Puia sp.]
MAELNSTATHSRRGGVGRGKRSLFAFGRRTGGPARSTRVDLTPMVDLGFLLITFFMVSTVWSKPHASILRMPADGDPTVLGSNAALTLVALEDDKVFYYNGELSQSLKEGSYGITGYGQHNGIGDIIRNKQLAMDKTYKGGRKEMMLLIKPTPGSNYKNVVGLLDEALINDVKRYALLDPSKDDQTAVIAQAAK